MCAPAHTHACPHACVYLKGTTSKINLYKGQCANLTELKSVVFRAQATTTFDHKLMSINHLESHSDFPGLSLELLNKTQDTGKCMLKVSPLMY